MGYKWDWPGMLQSGLFEIHCENVPTLLSLCLCSLGCGEASGMSKCFCQGWLETQSMSVWSWTKVWEERDEEEWQELGFHWLTLENTLLFSRD